MLLTACEKILCCSSKTCSSEAVWDDLGIEALDLRRNKRKFVWFLKLVKKVRIFFVETFMKKNGINVKFRVERKSSGRSVFQIL